MKYFFTLLGINLAFLMFANFANAQNVIRDYVVDKHATFSPDDATNRGLIYRMHTGHAGLFSQCDDDLQKLHSPYIVWNQRPCRTWNPLSGIIQDRNNRIRRLIDGAGDCVGVCDDCRAKKCKQKCSCCDAPRTAKSDSGAQQNQDQELAVKEESPENQPAASKQKQAEALTR